MQTQIVSINIREKRTSKVPLELPAKPTSPLQLKKPYEMARPKPATTLTRIGTALIRKIHLLVSTTSASITTKVQTNKVPRELPVPVHTTMRKQSPTRAPCHCHNHQKTQTHRVPVTTKRRGLSQPHKQTKLHESSLSL